MNKKIFCYFAALSFLTACINTESVYDPSYLQEIAKTNFPVKNIDPNQDWNLISSCSAYVSLNQKTNDSYKVRLFSSNPFDTDADARLLAEKDNVSDGSSFILTFDAPKALKYVYVMLEDGKYNRSVRMAEITNSNANIVWNTESSKTISQLSSRSTVQSRSVELPQIDFPTSIPAGAKNYSSVYNHNSNDIYYFEGTTGDNAPKNLNILWNTSGIKLYIKGNVNITSSQISNNYKVYILGGSKVNISAEKLELFAGTDLYVCEGASVNFAQEVSVWGKIYNKGSIDASSNRVVISNSENLFVNLGVLSSKELYLTTSGTLVNQGQVVIYDSLHMDSSTSRIENQSGASFSVGTNALIDNNSSLDNSGAFTTNKLTTTSGAIITNKCRLNVNSDASLEQLNLVVDGGCYIYFKHIKKLNNSKITLGDKSLLVVDSSLDFDGGNNTVYGPSIKDNTALLYVKENMNAGEWGIMKFDGFIARTSRKDLSGVQVNELNGASAKDYENVKLGAESGCGREFTLDAGGAPIITTPHYYTFAFEDMFKESGDYDFNDVIVKVSAPLNGKIKVILAAAGASKDLYLFYKYGNGSETALFGGKEVHDALSVPRGTLVNTGKVNVTPVEEEISVSSDFSISNLDIYIKGSEVSTTIHIPAHTASFEKGDVPYSILVPGEWDYPTETQCVINKYPKFVEWAQDATKSMNWYE